MERIAVADASNCPDCIGAIVARADEHGVGQRVQLAFHLIKRAIEEVLHRPGHVAKILWRADEECVRPQQIFGARLASFPQSYLHAFDFWVFGAGCDGVGKAFGVTGFAVVHDQQVFHREEYTCRMKFDDITAAAQRIQGHVVHTACERSDTLSALLGCDLYIKFENQQFTASFKERGALNCLLTLPEESRAKGVIAMSAGNHAQALAYHGARLGVPTTIVMPRTTPNAKVEQTRVHGAEVLLHGAQFEATRQFTLRLAKERDLTLVHPFDDPQVMAGQGTVGLEIAQQVPEAEIVVVPVGGGGLISGVSVALSHALPQAAIVGVQMARFDGVVRALRGGPKPHKQLGTVAEGIAVKSPGKLTLPLIKRHVSDMVVVDEDEVEQAIFNLLEIEKTVAEGAGAAALAALLADPARYRGHKVVVVLSGGNIDMMMLSSVLQRGMVRSRRLVRLRVEIPDVPGALGDLTQKIGELDSNIVDIQHQRAFGPSSVRATMVELVLQMRGEEQVDQVLDSLIEAGYDATLIA